MARPHNARAVQRHLRYAWLEYEDVRDAIAFDRGFSSAEIGGRNLFLDLPISASASTRRVSSNLPDLDIDWLRSHDNPAEQGVLARPTNSHNEFLVRWALNPGVADGQLTFEAADVQADLIVFSGHGAGGTVMGSASGSFAQIDLGRGLATNAAMPTSGRVKYLLLPACKLAAWECIPYWLPVLRKQNPLHGILGYEGPYPGDAIGAAIMRSFLGAIRQNPDMPILDAWAHGNTGRPWAALQLADSRHDSVARWVTEGLPEPSPTSAIEHYNHDSFAAGGRTYAQLEHVYSVRFAMPDGTDIQMSNNDPDSAVIGLFPGSHGAVVLRALPTGMSFQPGQQVRVVFYRFRVEHPEVDLDRLLTFDANLFTPSADNHPTITKAHDANVRKQGFPNGRVDGIDVSVHTASKEIRLPYTVLPANVISYYAVDGVNAGTRGRFWLLMIPPGVAPTDFEAFVGKYVDAAWLHAQ